MHASRRCGAEGSSSTPAPVSPTLASTRIRKGLWFALECPAVPLHAELSQAPHAVFLTCGWQEGDPGPKLNLPDETTAGQSEQRSRLAAVNAHTGPADPARSRRDEERDNRPDLFGAAEPAKGQFPPDELRYTFRILRAAAVPRST